MEENEIVEEYGDIASIALRTRNLIDYDGKEITDKDLDDVNKAYDILFNILKRHKDSL